MCKVFENKGILTMYCESECPVHLSSHIGYLAGVGATICQLGTKNACVLNQVN